MAKGNVGIVGLGSHGRRVRAQSSAAGGAVVGYDIDDAESARMARAASMIAQDVKSLAAAGEDHSSQPAQASPHSMRTWRRSSMPAQSRRVHRRNEHVCDRRQACGGAGAAARPARDDRLSGEGTVRRPRSKDLVIYARGERQSIRALRRCLPPLARAAHDRARNGSA